MFHSSTSARERRRPSLLSSSSQINIDTPLAKFPLRGCQCLSILISSQNSSINDRRSLSEIETRWLLSEVTANHRHRFISKLHTNLISQLKRSDEFKPSSTISESVFGPTVSPLYCRTISNPCAGSNMHCVPKSSEDCSLLVFGACDLPGICESIEMKPTPPSLTPPTMPHPTMASTTLSRKYSSYKHLPGPANPTAAAQVELDYCSSVTRPCKRQNEICIIPKEATCRYLVHGICDTVGKCKTV